MNVETIKVNYKESDLVPELDKIKAELRRLETFSSRWRVKEGKVLYWDGTFANSALFIRLGGIQKALKDMSYFGYTDGLFIWSIFVKHTWSDVLEILKSIDSIEVD